MGAPLRRDITLKTTHQFLSALFSEDIHAKRVYSLANATLGVISSASLAVNSIGQGLALARGRLPKHAIKQVDQLLSTHSRHTSSRPHARRSRAPWHPPQT